MYGVAMEYPRDAGAFPDAPTRAACREALLCQPGYRRRLVLQADGWRRAVDLFLFADADAARAALAGGDWRALVAAFPACRQADLALLVSECPYGGQVVLLRAGRSCPRDRLANAEPGAVLW